MTTSELVLWAYNAQTIRENSWSNALGAYRLTIDEAIKQICPNNATILDMQLCSILNHTCWNEVQDWAVMTNCGMAH